MGKATQTITTGVDRLVQLVMQKKRIALDEAAKALSMPKVLVEEWADFLEDKEVIGVDYKLGTPYLVYKEMTKQEAKEHAKIFASRREGFVRRVDSVLQYLEQESKGLPGLKQEMEKITKEIESKANQTKDDLKVLREYDGMKKAIDAQIADQGKMIEERRGHIQEEINKSERSVDRYLKLIEQNRQNLATEETIARLHQKSEAELEKKLLSIVEQAKAYEEKMKQDRLQVDATINEIISLKDRSKKAAEGVELQKMKLVELIEESKKRDAKIEQLRQKFLHKIFPKRLQGLSTEDINKVRGQFNKLFTQKIEAEKLINKLNTDVTALKKDLKDLSDEAMVMELRSKSKTVADYTKEFEKKFSKVNREKNKFHQEIRKLLDILKKP